MEKALYELLKTAIGDLKHGEKPALDLVVSAFDGDEAKEKVRLANEDLIKDRDSLKLKVKELGTSVEVGAKAIEDLKAATMTEEQKQKLAEINKNNGMSDDVQAQFNTMQESIEKLGTQITESHAREEIAKKEAQDALVQKNQTALKTKVLSAFDKVDIRGNNATLAMALVESEKMAKINNETLEENYTVIKDGKQFALTSVDELASHIAETHETLVSSNAARGAGQDHGSQQPTRQPAEDFITASNKYQSNL